MKKARKENKNTKKKVLSAIAILLVIGILVGGALAWNDKNQHKTNEFDSSGKKHDIRLIDEFDKPDDWKQGQEIDKKIRVANVGKSSLGFLPVYTRIQFKEYMEIGEVLYEYSTVRYMIYTEDGPIGSGQYEGHFIVYPTLAAARDDWGLDRIYAQYTDLATGDSGWLVPTDAKDPDGQYGKKVLINVTTGVATSIIPGVVRASDDAIRDATGTHDAGTNGECLYTIHSFNVGSTYYNTYTAKFAEYFEWILNDASIEYYSDWLADPTLARIGPIWLIDDTNDEGWVYWCDEIPPDDHQTANFMEAVKLILQPEGAFYYAIHVEMEGYSREQLPSGWLPPVPGEQQRAVWNPGSPSLRTVKVGATLPLAPDFTVTVEPPSTTPADDVFTWAITSGAGYATVNAATGAVTGVAVTPAGTQVVVTGTTPGGISTLFRVTVFDDPAPEAHWSYNLPNPVIIEEGKFYDIPSTVVIEVSPAGTTYTPSQLTWSIAAGDLQYATVNATTGRVTGVKETTPASYYVKVTGKLPAPYADLEVSFYVKVVQAADKPIGTKPGPIETVYSAEDWTLDGCGKLIGIHDMQGVVKNLNVDLPQAQALGMEEHAYPSWLLSDVLDDSTVNISDLQVVGVGTDAVFTSEFTILTDLNGEKRIYWLHDPTPQEVDDSVAAYGANGIPYTVRIDVQAKLTVPGRESLAFTLIAGYKGGLILI